MGLLDDRAGLAGKTAIIIGGGGGIGAAISRDLAQAGVDVAICDIDADALAETAAAIGEARLLLSRTLDACEAEQLQSFFAEFDAVAGKVDILVNVAGGTRFAMFRDTSAEDWERDARWNYEYVLHSCRLAIARMPQSGGAIVNITTIEAHRAAPGYSVYAGYKAALANFSRSLAVELGRDRIRVNTVAIESIPTSSQARIRTNFHWTDPDRADELLAEAYAMVLPLGRPGTHQELSNAVLFLVSDLSSFITGTALHVNGGSFASSGWIRWPGDDWYFPRPSPAALERLFPAPDKK